MPLLKRHAEMKGTHGKLSPNALEQTLPHQAIQQAIMQWKKQDVSLV